MSYQNQLIGTYTLAFTSNKQNIVCIVASVPHIILMYLCLAVLLVLTKLFGDSCIKPFGCFIAVTNSKKFRRFIIKQSFKELQGDGRYGDGRYAEF